METQPIPGNLAHFAINADDVARAQAFYEKAFQWRFEAYGPPGFYTIVFPKGLNSEAAPLRGALQGRRELVKGVRVSGFECTIAVEDIGETVASIEAAGGAIVMQKATLPGVGHLIFFQDTEGNLAGAMQYDSNAQ